MVPQHSVQWPRVEVADQQATQTQVLPPTTNTPVGGVRPRADGQESHQEVEVPQISRSIVHCRKARDGEEESNLGLVASQHSYPMRQVQDVNYLRSTYFTSSRSRNLLNRHFRCFLACPSLKDTVTVPRVPAGKTGFHLQGNALRSEYSSQDLHKVGGFGGPIPQTAGGSNCSLPGRLDSLGSQPRCLSEGYADSRRLSGEPGVSDQSEEIQTSPSLQISMVGSGMGSSKPQPVSPSRKTEGHLQIRPPPLKFHSLHQTSSGESSGVAPIRIHHRPCSQSQTKGCQQSVAAECHSTPKRSQSTNTPYFEKETSAMDYSQKPFEKNPPNPSTTISDNSYRCFFERLGRTCTDKRCTGHMVSKIPTIPHQRFGGLGSSSITKETQTTSSFPYQASPGQLSGSKLSEQRRLQNPSHQPCPASHLLPSQKEGLAFVSNSLRGVQECDSGCSIPPQTPGDGVVDRSPLFPLDPIQDPESPGGFVCHQIESQASLLRSPKPGPSGLCLGRPDSRLESMGEDLPLSPCQSPDESPTQAQVVSGKSGPGSPQMAQEQLVPVADGTQVVSNPPSQPSSNAESTNENCISFILANPKLTFMEFIEFVNSKAKQITPINTCFTNQDKGESSLRQYTSNYSKFFSFIREHKPQRMTIDLAISFFRELFDKGYAPSTITSIKSSLHKPFLRAFNIDTNGPDLSSIPKACARLRPSDNSTDMLPWNLNKILESASQVDNLHCDYLTILRKTLILVALASGARISEIAALSRAPGFVKFLPSGEALLAPHPKFLAKNENPQERWKPWKIVPLPQDPSLCPVKTLKDYLNVSSKWSTGALFVREKGGTLTTNGIRQQILYFVKNADPSCIPQGKVHLLRKFATSLNFFEYMNFSDIQKYTGWKSPKVFIKHYMVQLESLKFHTVAAGKVVHPRDPESEED